jgi:uncharacterized membrane protein (DUF485 family)
MIMNSKYLRYAVLAALVFFTAASAVNNYNSGVYADAHRLEGGSVGWFAPFGVLVFIISALATLTLGVYVLSRKAK